MADRPQQGINANDGSTVNADSVVNNFAPQEISQTNRDGGDNVAGDKVDGDKVNGHKYVTTVPQPGAESMGFPCNSLQKSWQIAHLIMELLPRSDD